MEMKKNRDHDFPMEEPLIHEVEQDEISPEDQEPQDEPFGPPRHHTVITAPTPHDAAGVPPFVEHLPPPPPPPSMDREGRSGIITEINQDAEVISPDTIEHHAVSVN